MKKVKNMIPDAKIKDENRKVNKVRQQGEKGGYEWFRFLRCDQPDMDLIKKKITVHGGKIC